MNLSVKRIERVFPTYKAIYGGGSMMLMYKDYPTQHGQQVMVSIGEESVIAFINEDGSFAPSSNVMKDDDSFVFYYDDPDHYVTVLWYDEDLVLQSENPGIFSTKVFRDIQRDFEAFSSVTSGEYEGKPSRYVLSEEEINQAFRTVGYKEVMIYVKKELVEDEQSGANIPYLQASAQTEKGELSSLEIQKVIYDYYQNHRKQDIECDTILRYERDGEKLEAKYVDILIDIYAS